jgi:hypothetical protein
MPEPPLYSERYLRVRAKVGTGLKLARPKYSLRSMLWVLTIASILLAALRGIDPPLAGTILAAALAVTVTLCGAALFSAAMGRWEPLLTSVVCVGVMQPCFWIVFGARSFRRVYDTNDFIDRFSDALVGCGMVAFLAFCIACVIMAIDRTNA